MIKTLKKCLIYPFSKFPILTHYKNEISPQKGGCLPLIEQPVLIELLAIIIIIFGPARLSETIIAHL